MPLKIAIIVVCAILWRMSGSAKYKGHWHRAICIPLLIGWYVAWRNMSVLDFFVVFAFMQFVRIGYGIPDETDKGSILGRIFGESATRAICGFLYTCFAPLGFRGDVHSAVIYMYLNFAVGWLGSYLKIKDVAIEMLTGAALGTAVLFI